VKCLAHSSGAKHISLGRFALSALRPRFALYSFRRFTFGNEIFGYGFLLASLTFSMLFLRSIEIENSHKRRLA